MRRNSKIREYLLPPDQQLLTPKEAAEFLGLAEITLARMRARGDGPHFARVGRSCRYSLAALRAYVKGRTFTSTSQEAVASRTAS
jgi:Helix-turn-helix domain